MQQDQPDAQNITIDPDLFHQHQLRIKDGIITQLTQEAAAQSAAREQLLQRIADLEATPAEPAPPAG